MQEGTSELVSESLKMSTKTLASCSVQVLRMQLGKLSVQYTFGGIISEGFWWVSGMRCMVVEADTSVAFQRLLDRDRDIRGVWIICREGRLVNLSLYTAQRPGPVLYISMFYAFSEDWEVYCNSVLSLYWSFGFSCRRNMTLTLYFSQPCHGLNILQGLHGLTDCLLQ